MLTRRFRFLIAAGLFALTSLSALADAPKASPLPPPDKDEVSVQMFGDRNPDCQEWTNSCQVCRRDDQGKMQCSLPGIACQPKAPVCRIKKPAP